MAYTAYYQITRLVGEIARTAYRAAKQARQSSAYPLTQKDIRMEVRFIRQSERWIKDLARGSLGGVASQLIFVGMLSSLRTTDLNAISLRDLDYTLVSRRTAGKNWRLVYDAIAYHFSELAMAEDSWHPNPAWVCSEVQIWFKGWRDNLQVYFNT